MKIEMKREQTESCSSLPSGSDLSKEPLIQLNRIQVGYDGKQVLRDIDLTVYTHDFLGVIGPNGGGKTTSNQNDSRIEKTDIRDSHLLP